MKKSLIILFTALTLMPMALFGQSYSALWKKVKEAEQKDLPKTQCEVLRQIADKARSEKAYGHLLRAELQEAQVSAMVAPDSLKPTVEQMAQRTTELRDEILRVVYQTVLYRIYRENPGLLEYSGESVQGYPKPVLTPSLCVKLSQIIDKTYEPFVVEGADSYVFGHDLLSIVGYELEDYQLLHDFYEQQGNLRAACLTALQALLHDRHANQENLYKSESLHKIDSLISVYEDLPEAGELAIERYRFMEGVTSATTEEKIRYIRYALGKWGSWKRMNVLRNAERELTNPQFQLRYENQIAQPGKDCLIGLHDLRNIVSLSMNVYQVDTTGEQAVDPATVEGYRKIKPLLTLLPDYGQERKYMGKADYELFDDSLMLSSLPVGVYMLEFSTVPTTETVRRLYYVTDVYTIAESQPGNKTRFVVVSATTGQPIAGAYLHLRQYTSYKDYQIINGRTDSKGEYIYEGNRNYRCEVYAYTDKDKACPEMSQASRYHYYETKDRVEQTSLFADRAIYRPGQTVHVAGIVYKAENSFRHTAITDKAMTLILRDANYKEVARQQVKTDRYGTCSADFILPASGLTGQYSIEGNNQRLFVRVEEYKRPAFEVIFPEVNQHYEAGDTVVVRAMAKTYAGVPVQEAVVKYKVVRRLAFWWWNYFRYWDTGLVGIDNNDEELAAGETMTNADGSFSVEIPLVLPESKMPLFCNFVVTADVTDQSGETHSGQLSLPLGNRKTALSVDLPGKILAEDSPQITFHLRNAAGNDISAQVRYQIDEGKWQELATQQSLELARLKSGRHTLYATCGNDTLTRDFVIFSRDDKSPAIQTDDWFWQSATQFPSDGTPVTIQVGSSDSDVHIVYSIFSGNRVLESGAVDKCNELINRKLVYKEEWGNGILLTFAWVKHGVCHSHTAQIQRPLPSKRMNLQWNTFRDRLTPGQQEEWTLTVTYPDGQLADAQLMATLYDKSLEQLKPHKWTFSPYTLLTLPSTNWSFPHRYPVSAYGASNRTFLSVKDLALSRFDASVFPSLYNYTLTGAVGRTRFNGRVMQAKAAAPMVGGVMLSVEESKSFDVAGNDEDAAEVFRAQELISESELEESVVTDELQVRENLRETAFFYPQLTTDSLGRIALKFTLPESLTTWRFMGLAHTTDMHYGMLEGETVAKKDVMIQPNMPRFLREGDKATLMARIFNTGEKNVKGMTRLRLLDPETEAVVFETSQQFVVSAGETGTVSFSLDTVLTSRIPIFICQVTVSGDGFSDGEQHYLPILPASEHVNVTLPFTQDRAGQKTIDLLTLIPADATDGKLTVEYTDNPAWLMIQALPIVGKPIDDNAISQAASFYANTIGKYILDQTPRAKTVFELWKQDSSSLSPLYAQLEKNQELKELLLHETPWVMDAERETEQKQRLADFFDENIMQQRLSSALEKLKTLQRTDGSWSWWEGMPGSFYMTVAVSEMLVRLNTLAGEQSATRRMLASAFRFMGQEVVNEVAEMKKQEKKGHKQLFPSFRMLQWLYLSTLDGRELPVKVQEANDYLLLLLKQEVKGQTLYEKALTAVIFTKYDVKRAADYVKSLKEYTVYKEEMGRYYDTPRAAYSWFDYRIPTQTAAIEALQRITPNDQQTITEMRHWLLQSKRTQAWDTPINSVNAVYAFFNGVGNLNVLNSQASPVVRIDGRLLETPKPTAGIGYVKANVPATSRQLTVESATGSTSWGAVYAQFYQPTKNITNSSSGIKVTRELLAASRASHLKVGDRLTVRITVEADRDYDFVQVVDRRAACLEPVRQLSGYDGGAYCTPRDNTTNYYFDRLSKGRHVIETEYYIDRPGIYETGTCTVQCAYAPEFRGTAKSQTINIQ